MTMVKGRKWLITGLVFICALFAFFTYERAFRKSVFTGKEKSIAVLPFVNTDSIKENEYFADGMTDEIIDQLSKIYGIRVIPRSIAAGFKNSGLKENEIANKLQVASILEGEIKKSGKEFNIDVKLVDGQTGKTIWSQNFDRGINDVFSSQNEIAGIIANKLNSGLAINNQLGIPTRPTLILEAYDQYLKGIYSWNKRDPASLRKGIDFFNHAIRLDSNYSKAWSGLADCYSALGYGSHDAPAFDFLKAETAARKALSLDSSLAEPHTSLGYIYFYYYWNWEKAEREFLTAIRMNPEYPLAYDSYGYYLTARERFPEAAAVLEKALGLDPQSAYINTDKGFELYYSGNYERAMISLRSTLELYPAFPLAHLWLGRTYQEKTMYEESLGEYEKALGKDKDWPVALAAKGFIYGVSNQRKDAEIVLSRLQAEMGSRYVTPYGIALIYAGLKDKEKAFEWLDKAYDDKANWLVWLKLDPRWSFIKTDKRYLALIDKIGLGHQRYPELKN